MNNTFKQFTKTIISIYKKERKKESLILMKTSSWKKEERIAYNI